MTRELHSFRGGLHLPGRKELSTAAPVRPLPLPKRLALPLQQHIGAPAQPIVEVGERVLKGQMVARPEGFVSVPVHAPASGTIVAITEVPVPHPSGLNGLCIVMEPDGQETWIERQPVADYRQLDPSALRNVIREAGIVGLGGAGFPSFIKLNPGARRPVETLILNGAECEPYITCDDMLMRERADEVIAGACIMRHAVQARECVIGVEDNKPEAFAALQEALRRAQCPEAGDIELVQVPTRYPTGGEKQLIHVLTGKEVPTQGLPIDVGVVCHNVATAAAVHRAVEQGEPLIARIVTVTGHGVVTPCNFEVPLGTPIAHLLEHAGGTSGDLKRLVVGGPMMGMTLQAQDAPVIKTVNCILAATEEDMPERGPVRACIRCGACAESCPARLLPQQLYWYARAKDFDKAQDYNLFDCIECGCCAYVCPANLPLVQFFRYAKTEIWAQERERKASDRARERHEQRQARLEAEKAERAARAQQKKAAVDSAGGEDTKKAAIKAAMERAKAKRDSSDSSGSGELSEEQRQKLAEARARLEAKRAGGAKELTEEQKQKIAEAKARAAAKKVQPDGAVEAAPDLSDDQRERLAAARARLEAKRAGAPKALTEEQKEKIAEAKARKAAKAAEPEVAPEAPPELSDTQRERLAAARARLEAKRGAGPKEPTEEQKRKIAEAKARTSSKAKTKLTDDQG